MLQKLTPRRTAILNFILAAAAYLGNLFTPIQLFCQPVMWAAIALIIFISAFVGWHFIKDERLKLIAMFIQGFGFTACLYCMMFIGADYLTAIPGIIWFGLGALAFVPIIFAIQLVLRFAHGNWKLRSAWAAGVLAPFIFLVYFTMQYGEVIEKIRRTEPATAEATAALLETNFITERIIGMHFRYHTAICMYDGWRPPLHDPMLVAAIRFNGGRDPLRHLNQGGKYTERIKLYRIMFPDRDPQADCVCALNGNAKSYRNDPRFKKNE